MTEEDTAQIHVCNPFSFSHNKVHCYLKKKNKRVYEGADRLEYIEKWAYVLQVNVTNLVV